MIARSLCRSNRRLWAAALLLAAAPMAMSADFPFITKLDPLPASVGKKLTIHGERFGDDRSDGFGKVWVARCRSLPDAPGAAGMQEYPRSRLLSWSDTRIEFILPLRSAGVIAVTSMKGQISPNVEFIITNQCQEPPPHIDRVSNAASLRDGPLSPGAIITLFGQQLGTIEEPAEDSPGTRLSIGNISSKLLYVSPGQVNAIVPPSLPVGQPASLVLENEFGRAETPALHVETVDPAIFTWDSSGAGQAVILNEDGTRNTVDAPAAKGSTIRIFSTGLGQVASSNIPPAPEVAVGGRPCPPAQVQQAAVPGVFEIRTRVPDDIESGRVAVSIRVGEKQSPTGVTLAVR